MSIDQLKAQRVIDTKAVLAVAAFGLVIALVGSTIIAVVTMRLIFPEENQGGNPAEGILLFSAWLFALGLLMPLWLWLASRVRRLINWPKGAFRNVPY